MTTSFRPPERRGVVALMGGAVTDAGSDPFPVIGVDHIRFAVGNAWQAAHFYCAAFGMTCVAYRGLEHVDRATGWASCADKSARG